LNAIKQQRQRTFDRAANRTIIREPDNRVIVRQNNRAVIIKNDSDRLARVVKTRSLTRSDGTNVTIIQRANNRSVYNVTDSNGQLVRRYRRNAQGHEHNIIDNRRRDKFGRNLALGVGIGVGVAAGAILLQSLVDVPPPRVDVPRRKYIVEYDQANDDDVYEAFDAPPVERLERRYTLDEVRATPRLRERMRRVDLNDITFETGSWEVNESEYSKLERVARAMMRVVERDADEVFMIEGYTDAVGSEDDNLTLSDRRAETVAVILTEQFQVPPENLTTQGFGEEYLKVETEGPERLNRRVAVRRITPLLSQNEGDGPPAQ
jgi:outer membrane protein OmpA-like peptidoglycan-associated protein